jgi:hypothetical protein
VVFPCFFLSCKANARVKTRKDEARPALFHIICYLGCSVVYLCCSVYCLCVNVYCHRVTTQLQLINILLLLLLYGPRIKIRNILGDQKEGTHISISKSPSISLLSVPLSLFPNRVPMERNVLSPEPMVYSFNYICRMR